MRDENGMRARQKTWNRSELLVVFRLYCRTPFGRLHHRNPEIIELARLIRRTPSAVSMKACNFASLDPQLKARNISALGNVSKADSTLWEDFMFDSESIAHDAEAEYSALTGKEAEDYMPEFGGILTVGGDPASQDIPRISDVPSGSTEKDALVKVRRVQSFFRTSVLISYDYRCALTGLSIPELLNASHIIPWSVDEKRRADPRNGICLNALHDRAFDRGLISFDENLRVVVSSQIKSTEVCAIHRDQLLRLAGKPLHLPDRFQPEDDALEYHRNNIFRP